MVFGSENNYNKNSILLNKKRKGEVNMVNKQVISEWSRVILGDLIEEPNKWEITERLSNKELQAKLTKFNDEFGGHLVRHINSQGAYRIDFFSVLNKNGKAEIAVNYHPYDENTQKDYPKVNHTRPAREFFDGRFMI